VLCLGLCLDASTDVSTRSRAGPKLWLVCACGEHLLDQHSTTYAMVFYALVLLPYTIRHKGRVLPCSFIHSPIICA
jgi:hypothetical protein